MYKIMVVDDEPIVSLTIKAICNWEENGIEICCEASNGKQALKLLKEHSDIDIVITDLNMPIMDGIDLIKSIKEENLNQKLIVLSSHKDYGLVREAFKLGVEDYILKTEIDENNLLELIKTVINKIEKEGKQKKYITQEETKLLKQGILKSLLENSSTLKLEKQHIKNNIKLGEQNICAFYILIDDYEKIEQRYINDLSNFILSVQNTIKNIIGKEHYGETISISAQEYVILYSNENEEKDYIDKKINTLLEDIKSSLFNYMNITATIGVSSLTNGYENINNIYKEAENSARLKVQSKEKKYSHVIQRALKYIKSKYHDPDLALKDVSSHVELSDNYFSVLFSNEVGISFKEHLINLRVNKAKELITDSNLKIYEICEEVGYKNVEHFSRIFKKVTGLSPNGFKKN